MNKKMIAFFTGNRAEFGLQYPIIKAISEDNRFDYVILISGAHLKEDFGTTKQEIKSLGFENFKEIEMKMPGDTLKDTTYAIGSGIINIGDVLSEINPDYFVVYADRFESFAAMVAGTQIGIPTAHIEGGDYTEGGALDDTVRHAMTKLAHLHFATNEEAVSRIAKMGEEPWRIFNVGYPALDLINAGKFAQPPEVYERLELDPKKPILVLTQHSVTTEFEEASKQIIPTLNAIEMANKKWGCQTVITYPNDDAGGKAIISELESFMHKKVPGVSLHQNLGRHLYHGILSVCSACMGNSSSGIKETPAFFIPSIDIGSRQKGRLRGKNVINTDYDEQQILDAVEKSLFDEKFKTSVKNCVNPYGAGNAGKKIADVLSDITIDRSLIQKKMTY